MPGSPIKCPGRYIDQELQQLKEKLEKTARDEKARLEVSAGTGGGPWTLTHVHTHSHTHAHALIVAHPHTSCSIWSSIRNSLKAYHLREGTHIPLE